ncbi:Rap1a/Tai family immunity protein [Mesorhizobium sp. M0814]|uniref:Rap1a/Tai family immunity protein n=1 Tax=unclassified Mesorhizobium TaxID=325217 RepID=UPI00333DAC85
MKTMVDYSATLGLVLVAISAYAPPALAEYFEDGNALNELCTNGSAASRVLLRGYAMAIADVQGVSMGIVDDATGSAVMPRKFVCVPVGASSKQVEDVTCNYLADHPEVRQLPGPGIVHNALLAAWPCSQK